jgi:hypothetical protein
MKIETICPKCKKGGLRWDGGRACCDCGWVGYYPERREILELKPREESKKS